MTIGEKIKYLREKIGMTQSDIAVRLGIATQTVFKYEKNIVTNIPLDNIEKLAKIFDVTPAYIMGWEDNPSKEVSTLAPPILTKYNKLNDIGQRKTEAYIDDLLAVPLYRKDSASDEDLKLVAETPVSIKPKINDEPEHT